MRIKITNLKVNESDISVKFTMVSGNGMGLWKGNSPEINKEYDIECDIDDDFVWGENIHTFNGKTEMMEVVNSNVRIIAKVINFDNDGCLVVTLNKSILLLNLEIENENECHLGMLVEFWAKDVSLYPINL